MAFDKIAVGREIGCEVLDILGLDKSKVTGLQISLDADSIATVTITRHLTQDEADGFVEVFERYNLKAESVDADS